MRDEIGRAVDKKRVIAERVIARGAAFVRECRPIVLADNELEAVAAAGSKLGGSTEGRR